MGTVIPAPQDDVMGYGSPTFTVSYQMLHQALDTSWHSNTLEQHLDPL